MAPRTKLALSLTSAALVATAATVSAQPSQGGRKFTTTLTGAQECSNATPPVCGVGDPDGRGTATVTVNVGQRRVCWDIRVQDIAAPTRGHIHNAPAGRNGGIVVGFFEPDNVDLDGCTTTPLSRDLLTDILKNPQNYYVNVHNAEFPGGAIRGQLSK